MSTKSLRELVEWAARGDNPHVDAARAELEAIEKAARDLAVIHSGKPLSFAECCDGDSAVELFATIANQER